MARVCEICGKKPDIGQKYKKLMSRYNPSKKVKYPNLQWVTLPSGKRIKVCAKCKKTTFKKLG